MSSIRRKDSKTSLYIISYQVNVNITIVRWRRNESVISTGGGEVIAMRWTIFPKSPLTLVCLIGLLEI